MKKKWLFIIPLLLGIIIWQAFNIYFESISSKTKREQHAITYVNNNVKQLDVINEVEYYHGRLAYHVVYGTTDNNEQLIVWVPDSDKGEMLIRKANEGWSKEKVKSFVLSNQNPLKLIDIRLGAELMMDNRTKKTETTPLWEVTYIDQQNRYTYYFLKFIDGSFVKRYSLKKDRFKEEN